MEGNEVPVCYIVIYLGCCLMHYLQYANIHLIKVVIKNAIDMLSYKINII